MKKVFVIYSLCFTASLLFAEQPQQPKPLRVGKHMMSLQWLWNQYGTITISKPDQDNWQEAQGKMETPEGFLSINGKLKPINSKELIFEGDILSKAASINNNEVCTRNGTYHFKTTGKRKYWRLQEMANCEGNNVVDYIDIYFN